MKLTDDGKKALLKLSKGDMRRALNILQACHAAFDTTTETDVYACTGNPLPADIESIVNSMLGEDFTTSYESELLLLSCFALCSRAFLFLSSRVPDFHHAFLVFMSSSRACLSLALYSFFLVHTYIFLSGLNTD